MHKLRGKVVSEFIYEPVENRAHIAWFIFRHVQNWPKAWRKGRDHLLLFLFVGFILSTLGDETDVLPTTAAQHATLLSKHRPNEWPKVRQPSLALIFMINFATLSHLQLENQ